MKIAPLAIAESWLAVATLTQGEEIGSEMENPNSEQFVCAIFQSGQAERLNTSRTKQTPQRRRRRSQRLFLATAMAAAAYAFRLRLTLEKDFPLKRGVDLGPYSVQAVVVPAS